MSDYAIVACAACGMEKNLRDRFGIDGYVRTHIVFPDGSSHEGTLDWEEISADEYFGSMATKKAIYKSAVCSVECAAEEFEKYLSQGRDILCVTISTGLSATYSVFCKAWESLQEKYPERKVIIVDSLRYSGSIATILIKASELRAQGKTLEENAAWIEANKNRFHEMGTMNDLQFLRRVGRINGVKAFFGGLVGVHSLGEFARNGLTTPLCSVKGEGPAIAAVAAYVKATIEEPENQIVIISHSYRPETAEKMRAAVEAAVHPKEIIMNRIDMMCGASIGPGMAVTFYYGKEISEDLSVEKAFLEKLTAKEKK